MVAVHRKHGENADELDALLHLGLEGVVPHRIIIGGQRQHAAGQAVHQILAGGFHDNVPHKVAGQVAAFGEAVGEGIELIPGGQVAQQQQIGDLLKAVALAPQAADQVVDIVTPVPQLALTGGLDAVAHFEGINAGDVGDARNHTIAVLVPQAALDAVPVKQDGVDGIVAGTDPGKNFSFLFNGSVFAHDGGLLCFRNISQLP